MVMLKELANFIRQNMADLVATYTWLLAEREQGNEADPVDERMASAHRLLEAVIKACETRTTDPLYRLYDNRAGGTPYTIDNKNITPSQFLLEIECLGQTLLPTVTHLESGKFLWQLLSEARTAVLQRGGVITPSFNPNVQQEAKNINQIGEELTPFFELALDLLCIADKDAYFKRLNPAFEATLGWSLAELMNRPFFEFIHPDDVSATLSEIEKLAQRGVATDFENRFRCKDGSYKWLAWNVQSAPEGLLYATARNVTAQKQTADALAKRVTELEAVSQVGVAVSTILEVNRLLQTVVDLTKERFELYHAHIYLVDREKEVLNLAAGAGEVGRQMVAEGWSIPLMQEHSLVAEAARTKRGIIANDVRKHSGFLSNPLLPETRSEMAIPMIIGDTVLGVLDVQAKDVNRFNEEEVRIKTILASQIAIALENARLFEQSQHRISREKTIREITEKMQAASSLEALIRTTAEELGKRLSAGHAVIELGIASPAYNSLPVSNLPNNEQHKVITG